MEIDERNVLRVVGQLYKQLSPPPSPSPSPSLGSSSENKQHRARPRSGGKESFGSTKITHEVGERECERCYRVLTYKQSPAAGKVLVDLVDGKVFSYQVTQEAVVYQTRQAALSERFPPSQVGRPKSGSGILPRVLVAFDCWGQSVHRTGGGPSCVYEFAKYIGIVQCLDPVSPHPLKHASIPVSPHFFPKRDKTQPPRRQNSRLTRVTLNLNS